LLSRSHVITIKDIVKVETKEYKSIRSGAREFNTSHATFLNYLDKNKEKKDRL